MPEGPLKLASARILVTNDDGIHAPGLKVLERIAKRLSRDVWVVAPETEQSAASHALTLRRPLRVRRLAARRFSVDGTPTDCALLGLRRIVPGRRPDLVLSGVNHGGNLGEDVTYSGTVAAALEATLLGVRAVAFSQVRSGDGPVHWATAEHFAPGILARLAAFEWPSDMLVNVDIIGASVRYFLNLAGKATWSVMPADDSDAAEDVAEFVDDVINGQWITAAAGEHARDVEQDSPRCDTALRDLVDAAAPGVASLIDVFGDIGGTMRYVRIRLTATGP